MTRLRVRARGNWDTTGGDWSDAAVAAGRAVYERMQVGREAPMWDAVDLDVLDHYCIAGRDAVDAALRSLGVIGGAG